MSDFNVQQLLKRINELETELKSMKKYGIVWDNNMYPMSRTLIKKGICY